MKWFVFGKDIENSFTVKGIEEPVMFTQAGGSGYTD